MNRGITLIYTTDLENISFVQECKSKWDNCISAVDARSAVYMATGICAQNQTKVVVCVDSGNESRSSFSGMTEAYYRRLPVALISVGNKLNYTRELNDVVVGHYTALNYDDVQQYLQKGEFPMHIELVMDCQRKQKVECNTLQEIISSLLDENMYLYFSQSIKIADVQYKSKVVYGGMPDCFEGALSNVLGASLARKHKKYIGLISEKDFIHDINTLGNINMNDLVCYLIVSEKKNKLILDYATAMKFETGALQSNSLQLNEIKRIIMSKNKGILLVYREG